jgi:hypothetical protein
MARNITAGVLLDLKDQLSSKIRGAGVSVQGFANDAASAAEKVNKAFSGTAGILGGLGISIGALSAVKSTIDLDNRLVRLGLTANLDAREVNELKRAIFETAQLPDIKLDTGSIISGLEVILEKTGDIGQAGKENIANLARAIQAAGTEGAPMGDVFSEFAKNKFSAEEITKLMDDIITISDMGEYTFVNFANTAKSVLSSYSLIGNTPEDVKNAVIAMQVLTAGTKSADVAATVLDSTMRELTDPKKRKALEALGISIRDNATGEYRDFNDILLDVAEAYKDFRKADDINTLFGSETQRAIRAYGSEFAKTIPQMKDLGDTAGTLAGKSAVMADTLKANLQNLQTAFYSFADKNLTGPLQDLTNLLNKLAENPEQIEAWMRSVARGIAILAGVKIGAGIMSFLSNLKSLQGGNAPDLSGLANAAGGAGIPVHVTNWGGTGSPVATGSAGLPGIQTGGNLVDQYGNPLVPPVSKPTASPPSSPPASKGKLNKPNWKGAAASAGISAAITAGLTIPGMISELNGISESEELTEGEKGRAKGGAVGETAGAIGGAAAGALAGAAIGSIVPVVGTALGGIVGGLIGQFGGPAGRIIGEKIGAAVGESRELDAAQSNYAKAREEAADVIGKTTEEIEQARQKLTEAEERLEKAKEADAVKKAEDEAKKRSREEFMNAGISVYGRTGDKTATTYGGEVWHNNYVPPGLASVRQVNDLILTPQGQFSTHPDDYILAMKSPAAPVNNRYLNFQGAPGIVQHNTSTAYAKTVNDLILTPQGQFSTHPDDYILAMKNPAALVNNDMRTEVRTVERISQAMPPAPVVVEGEIELHSALVIDDKGYRLRQSVGKNTTPYKFAVGSAKNARLIQ